MESMLKRFVAKSNLVAVTDGAVSTAGLVASGLFLSSGFLSSGSEVILAGISGGLPFSFPFHQSEF